MSGSRIPTFFVFAGNRRKARDWLGERSIDETRDRIALIVHADELGECAAGAAFDLTGLFPASGPLRRAMEARRDRFAWLTEAEFIAETRRLYGGER